MTSATVINWIQVVTGIAVFVGLILVVWELQQSREATMSQLSSDHYQISSQQRAALYGEDAADVLAKACESPNDLSHAEFLILDAIYNDALSRLERMFILSKRGSFYTDEYWRDRIGNLDMLFMSHSGRAYWHTIAKNFVSTEIREAGDAYLANWDRPNCVEEFDIFKQTIRQSIESER